MHGHNSKRLTYVHETFLSKKSRFKFNSRIPRVKMKFKTSTNTYTLSHKSEYYSPLEAGANRYRSLPGSRREALYKLAKHSLSRSLFLFTRALHSVSLVNILYPRYGEGRAHFSPRFIPPPAPLSLYLRYFPRSFFPTLLILYAHRAWARNRGNDTEILPVRARGI